MAAYRRSPSASRATPSPTVVSSPSSAMPTSSFSLIPSPSSAPAIVTHKDLQRAADALFRDFASPGVPCHVLLSHFSTTHLVTLDHSPANQPSSPTYDDGELPLTPAPLIGLNAVRSYFDLLSMHYTRLKMTTYSTHAYPDIGRVVATASILWRWNRSGKEWTEDVECTLDFDEHLKVRSFIVKTQSPADTCVMRAVDHDASYRMYDHAQDRTPHVFSA